jgi:pyruvate,water dikinase
VRSSATAEDLPDASFAGQQETFLNVRGEAQGAARHLPPLLRLAVHRPGDHLPQDQGLRPPQVALSIGVQLMVRSDIGGSGVMFSIDTEPASTRWC